MLTRDPQLIRRLPAGGSVLSDHRKQRSASRSSAQAGSVKRLPSGSTNDQSIVRAQSVTPGRLRSKRQIASVQSDAVGNAPRPDRSERRFRTVIATSSLKVLRRPLEPGQDGAVKVMRLAPDEFIRRFLLHTLPDGFHRIRYFGFLANRRRAANLALCRRALAQQIEPSETPIVGAVSSSPSVHPPTCPECGGVMRMLATLSRGP